jgi:GPH family glycoside/pentoside/hexuronide:cation symporter
VATIRICMGLIPAILVVLGMLVMRHWPEKGLHRLHRAAP